MDGKTLYVILTANASAYRAALKGAGNDTRQFGRDVDKAGDSLSRFDGDLDKMGKSTRRVDNEINSLSGRLRIFLDAFALIGPATVPIAAVAVPAVFALSSMLALTAAGAGTLALGMMGVSDTLKAMRKAELEPTAANLADLHQRMSDLAPAARAFVTELDAMRPRLDLLQTAAAQGVMPGLTRGLEEFDQMIPETTGLIYELADSMGDLIAEGVESLGSERWQGFFRFLEAEARPAMQATVSVAGDLAHGLAELWQAFDPISDDFTGGLVDMADAFDQWATGLSDTRGFQEFVDYVRETGPQVIDTLSSIGNAAVQIVQAVSPLGGPALQGLEIVFDGLANLADSPIGPSLFAAAAALTLLNRSLSVTGGLLTRMGFTGAGAKTTNALGQGGVLGQIGAGSRATATSVRESSGQIKAGLAQITSTYATAGARTARETARIKDGFRQVGSGALAMGRQVAGGAAAVGAMALLSTETGRGLGLTNTALLGLTGSIAGPPGAAIGAGVGLLLDLKSAGEGATDALQGLDDAVASNDMSKLNAQISQATAELEDYNNLDFSAGDIFQRIGTDVDETLHGDFTGRGDEYAERLARAREEAANLQGAYGGLARAMGVVSSTTADSAVTQDQFNEAVQMASPAMTALGISVDDLRRASGSGMLGPLVGTITAYQTHADSAAGRTEAFGSSVADLANDALATADSAAAMGAALDALLGPTLDAEAATDAWHLSLQELRKELDDKAGFSGFGEAAIKNKQLTRDYVTDSKARLTALAGLSTTTERDMANAVKATRQEFIQSGIAAGFSRKEITRRANALGLTPKLVSTTFKAAGLDKFDLQAREVRENLRKVPKEVRTHIRTHGIPETTAEVNKLVKRYELSEKERRALVAIKNLASPELEKVLAKLGLVDRAHPRPSVTVETGGAFSAIQGVANALSNLDGNTADTFIYTHRVTSKEKGAGGLEVAGVTAMAGGGYGQDGRYYSRSPRIVAGGTDIRWGEKSTGWEAYISGDPAHRDRNIAILNAAAGRLGLGSDYVTGNRQAPVVVRGGMPDRLTLVLDSGERFTAYVRGHAADVVDQHMGEADSADHTARGMNWS